MNKNYYLNLRKFFRLNGKFIFKKSASWLVGIYAALGLVAAFMPLDDLPLLYGICGFWCQILVSVFMMIVWFFLCLVVATVCVMGKKMGKKMVKVLAGRNGKSAYLIVWGCVR